VRWALVLLLAGCNALYGLDGTSADTDRDGDGHFDSQDVCPTIPDPDQPDSDGDGVGDACDPCVEGVQLYVDADHDGVDDGCDPCPRGAGDHDEDGDLVLDACDVCPGVKDDQANADGDDLGDACDPDPTTAQMRLSFTGFAITPATWIPSNDEWKVENDTIGPVPAPTNPSPQDGLWNRTDQFPRRWSVETEAPIPSPVPENFIVGIALRTRAFLGLANSWCQVGFAGGVWHLDAKDAQPKEVTITTPTVRLRTYRDASDVAHCEVAGESLATSVPLQIVTPSLYTGPTLVRFNYVDVAR
jgi:hypothetical protein